LALSQPRLPGTGELDSPDFPWTHPPLHRSEAHDRSGITKKRKNTMKNNTEAKKEQTPKDQALKAKAPKAKREPAAKVVTKADVDSESTDRLPSTIDELKATKGGLVSFLFLSGKDKEEIVKDLKAAFNLSDVQAVKIVRRIMGRARFFQRAFELIATK
jgi:hypothetical protein